MKTIFTEIFAEDHSFNDYAGEVNHSNGQTIRYLIGWGIPLSAIAVMTQYFMGYHNAATLALRMLIYFIVLAILDKPLLQKIHNKTALIYILQIPILLLVMLMGTFMDPNHQAITIFVFISVMPILILDRRYRVTLWTLGWLGAFVFFSHLLKESSQFRGDLLYSIEFGFASIMVSWSVNTVRLRAIRLYMKSLPPTVDPLTGLSNAYHFLNHTDPAIKKMIHDRKMPCIIYMDVINMKSYNERFGYEKGSALLVRIAENIKSSFPQNETARLSEDHFVVLTSMAERDSQLKNLHNLINAMEADGIYISLSTGTYPYYENVEPGIACDRAKAACDAAKENQTAYSDLVYDNKMAVAIQKKQYVLDHLEEAIENDWLQVYYQPIVRSTTGDICSEEALSRWIDPEYGLISPAEFIPPLEDNGLNYLGDLHVVRCVVRNIKQRLADQVPVVPISVNLSRTDFMKVDMVKAISDICDDAKIPHRLINIEITESAMIHHETLLKKVIHQFHEAGFEVWMDDFGSGYSSLNALKEYEFDLIKFDMRFAKDLYPGSKAEVIMADLIQMANELGIETLAEGVETAEHIEILRSIGCGKLQGFYFNKPNDYGVIIQKYRSGSVTFEDPELTEFSQFLSSVNLNDVTENTEDNRFAYVKYRASAIAELHEDHVVIVRANQEYIDFMDKVGRQTERDPDNEFYTIIHPNEVFLKTCDNAARTRVTQHLIQDSEGDLIITAMIKYLAKNPKNECDNFLVSIEKVQDNAN